MCPAATAALAHLGKIPGGAHPWVGPTQGRRGLGTLYRTRRWNPNLDQERQGWGTGRRVMPPPRGLDVRTSPVAEGEKCFLLTSPFIEPSCIGFTINLICSAPVDVASGRSQDPPDAIEMEAQVMREFSSLWGLPPSCYKRTEQPKRFKNVE